MRTLLRFIGLWPLVREYRIWWLERGTVCASHPRMPDIVREREALKAERNRPLPPLKANQ